MDKYIQKLYHWLFQMCSLYSTYELDAHVYIATFRQCGIEKISLEYI